MSVLGSSPPTLYEYYTGDGITSGLSVDQPHFTLNGKNISIYSGAMHYFRIPRKYWRDRLKKLRASGLNTVETYVPWNLHEPQNGVYDFGEGGTDYQDFLDVQEYLKIAQEEDLFAIVRPGPYICAEWEWGGLPSWLLREQGIAVRTSDSKYFNFVKRYFNILLPLLTALQFMNGGPIIGFQVENEYGSSPTKDLDYIQELVDVYKNNSIKELLITSDGPGFGSSGSIPGLLFQTINFGSNPKEGLDILRDLQPGKPYMVMEYWSGWFDHWTETHHTVSNSTFRSIYEEIVTYPASVNLYMFHGGTNFGFLNGANSNLNIGNKFFQPTTTSYDYDAPLSEAGDYTGKYEIVRELLKKYNSILTLIPDPPVLIPRVAYPSVQITETLPFQDALDQAPYKLSSPDIIPMELLDINNSSGQSYGYIVYQVDAVDIPAYANLTIKGYVYDSVMVLVNGEIISQSKSDLNDFGYWRNKDSSITLSDADLEDVTIQLVVANWGRVNFGHIESQFKGLQDKVLINDKVLTNWQIVPLEFKTNWTNNLSGWTSGLVKQNGPALYKGILKIDDENPADTFVNMQNWNEGIVIINGFVLGRYAKIGPQQTLYLPGPFLKTGANEIVIFEHFYAPSANVEFIEDPIFYTQLIN